MLNLVLQASDPYILTQHRVINRYQITSSLSAFYVLSYNTGHRTERSHFCIFSIEQSSSKLTVSSVSASLGQLAAQRRFYEAEKGDPEKLCDLRRCRHSRCCSVYPILLTMPQIEHGKWSKFLLCEFLGMDGGEFGSEI